MHLTSRDWSRFLSPAVLVLLLAVTGAACQAKDATLTAFPPALLGTWQVTDVRTDRGDTRPWAYKYNPHKFLGRVFVFTPERLTSNALLREGPCDGFKVVVRRTTALKVVSHSVYSRPGYETGPGPKDFGLPIADNAPVEALALHCKEGPLFGGVSSAVDPLHPDEIRSSWLMTLNPEQLALSLYDGVFLILQRLPKDAKPTPSFDCAKASTNTEKTICGSVALAAYDKSVAGTYQHALSYYDFALKTYNPAMRAQTLAQTAAFKKSQKEWLTERDACGRDTACLEKAMANRIDDIDSEIALYAYDNRYISGEYERKTKEAYDKYLRP